MNLRNVKEVLESTLAKILDLPKYLLLSWGLIVEASSAM